jgi:putative oxidoreductase
MTRLERVAMVYARVALGTAFLSAVAGRFGIWDRSVDWAHFERFIHRTGEVNAFMPAFTIPFLAWAATVAEITCGVALIAGFQLRWAALGSAILLFCFATAMAISLGVKPPLDYSVFSASAGALLLALRARRNG